MFFIAENHDIPSCTYDNTSYFEGQATWHLFLTTSDNVTMNIQDLNPSRPDPRRREKNSLSFYFQSSLWCMKSFYEGLKGLHKTF